MNAYRNDSELNTYFGGRAAYLATMRADLAAARHDLANFVPVIITDPAILAAFGQPSDADQKSIIEQRICALRATLMDNSAN